MVVERSAPFDRDVRRLIKRYRSLEQDLQTLQRVLIVRPNPPTSFSVELAGYGGVPKIVKVRKMACRSLPGRGAQSGLRVIYALGRSKLVLLELYSKSDQAHESEPRIRDAVRHWVESDSP